MKKTFVSLLFLLFIYSSLFSQNTYTISGYVQEEATGEIDDAIEEIDGTEEIPSYLFYNHTEAGWTTEDIDYR